MRNLSLPCCLLIVTCFASAAAAQVAPRPTRSVDSLKIVDVSSKDPVQDGVPNEFTVQIEYTLQSGDEAAVSIGFNLDDPGRYRMTGKKRIVRGTGVLTLKASVTPKDWKERGDFILYANISPYPATASRYRPLATTDRVIEFGP